MVLNSFVRDRNPTCARFVEFVDEIKHCIHTRNVAVWTIIGAETFVYHPCFEYPRQIFVCYTDAGVGFSVF